jgi:hypothetical protein
MRRQPALRGFTAPDETALFLTVFRSQDFSPVISAVAPTLPYQGAARSHARITNNFNVV